MSAQRNGWQAEAYVQRILETENPVSRVIPLAPSYPADLLVLGPFGSFFFVEVKGGRTKATAKRKLTPAEEAFRNTLAPSQHQTWRILTKPRSAGGGCEVISRGA